MSWQYFIDALEDLNNIPNSFVGTVAMSANDIDFEAGAIFTKTIAANTTITISNPIPNKVVTVIISGDFALTLPSSVKVITGEYDGTVDNYIQIHCVDAVTPSFWAVISQEEL